MNNSTKTTRFVPITMILVVEFYATSFCKSPCDGIDEAVNTTCTTGKPPKVFDLSILDYRAILDLCENEMMTIRFFGNQK